MSDSTDILKVADALQREADQVVRESGLAGIFSRLGSVGLVGGYGLRVLTRPDIDVVVTADSLHRAAAVEVTRELLDHGYFQSVVFIDHFSFEGRCDADMSSRGFYWCLDVPKPDFGRQWKCDVWYIQQAADHYSAHATRFEALLKRNPAARKTILMLKDAFSEGKGYRAGANGFRIYEAVLEHGITAPDEFAEYLAKVAETW